MPHFAERQRGFAKALLDPTQPTPSGLVGPDGEPSQRRFSVYRNNVVAGLTGTLKDAFPAVQRIVGEDFFRAMARAYVVSEPPRSPILLDYGARFPDFIGRFQPAEALAYLAEVARLERAWTEAYHSPEAEPLDRAPFAAIEADRLPQICFMFHPSVRVVRSLLPSFTIWGMNIGEGVPEPVDLSKGGEDALVVRPVADVEVRLLPPGGADLILALAAGNSVTEATVIALAADARFDLVANLTGLIGAGAVVGYSFARKTRMAQSGRRA